MPADVREYVESLVTRLAPPAIVLFGSAAAGQTRRGSDYDLFVLARGLPADFWERQDLLWAGKPLFVDVVGFTADEVKRLIHRGLILDALLEGIVLSGDLGELPALAKQHVKKYGLKRGPVGWFRREAG